MGPFIEITEPQRQCILGQFPRNIKLSYETILHNKVYHPESTNNQSIFMAIPKGRKVFLWFRGDGCYSLSHLHCQGRQNQPPNIQKVSGSFPSILDHTIVYGTLFYLQNKQAFSIEDIFYFQGKNISQSTFINKLSMSKKVLDEVDTLTNLPIHFGIPILSTDYPTLLNRILDIKTTIPIYCILIKPLCVENANGTAIEKTFKILYNENDMNVVFVKEPKTKIEVPIKKTNTTSTTNIFKMNLKPDRQKIKEQPLKKQIFRVKPDLQNDIYHLYQVSRDHKGIETENYFDIAYIPDYKTSVMMNKIFRIIKENYNLDALEESDDEEEFENEKEDQFVYLDKTVNMECYFHRKFDKFVPSMQV